MQASIDLLIEHGTVITLDPQRRVIEDGAVAVHGDRIVAVGPTAELQPRYRAAQTLDARRQAVLPGFVDAHAHAGHALLRTLGAGDPEAWSQACAAIYTRGSDEEFWEAESALASLERLKAGVTTGVSLLGGGDSVMRLDDPKYARAHARAVERAGTRSLIAIGPTRPGGPTGYADWSGGTAREREVDASVMLEAGREVVRTLHGAGDGRIGIAVVLPVYAPMHEPDHAALRPVFAQQARDWLGLAHEHGLALTQDGHRAGTLALARREFSLLGEPAFMSHCIDLTEDDIAALRDSGAKVVHNPSAIMSIRGRCPVPELIDAGITVAIGSDGAAPDRGYDMFRHMWQCMHYHRRHARDPLVLPHGKVLEMATIDAARAIGLDNDIGSLEAGKRADLILVDLFKPHLLPMNMPVYRVTCFANAADVDTTIVAGRILMRGRRVLSVDETEVLERAQAASERMLERSGLAHLTQSPPRLWGASHY
jgi:5-methylthioadenosine/S-adenosylhomocysteine deaminase